MQQSTACLDVRHKIGYVAVQLGRGPFGLTLDFNRTPSF
jgi:hypothetical protein